MDPKTRLLAIRLMEYLRKNPAYAQTLGVQVTLKRSAPIPIWRRLRASLLGEALFCREN